MKILETHPVPVVPVALQNLWGSFSRASKAAKRWCGRFVADCSAAVGLVGRHAVPAASVTPEVLQTRVGGLLELTRGAAGRATMA